MRFATLLSIVLLSSFLNGCKRNDVVCFLMENVDYARCVETNTPAEYNKPEIELKQEHWICVSPDTARDLKEDYFTCERKLRRCEQR